MAELERLGVRQVIGVEGLLPRLLYEYRVRLEHVLDLSADETRGHLGVSLEDLTSDDLTRPRALGQHAYHAGLQALRSPSATGVGEILAVFPELIPSDSLRPRLLEEWRLVEDLRRGEK